MTNTNHKRERRLSVRSARRAQPDMRRLARVLIEFAVAEAETQASSQAAAPPVRRPAKREDAA